MYAVLSYEGGGVSLNFASVPEGDLELFVYHLSLVHQTVVQKLLHEVRGNNLCCT